MAARRAAATSLLALGVGGLVAACDRSPGGKPAAKDDNPVLAEVGPYTITRKELERRLAQLEPELQRSFNTPDKQAEFLSTLVEEKLILLAAESKGFEKHPEVKERLQDARTQVLVRQYIADVLNPAATPDSLDFERYYRENSAEFQMAERVAARQIVTKTAAEAQAVRRRLIAGEPFEGLVKQSVDEQTRNLGGALGWIQRGAPVRGLGQNPAFIDSVLAVPEGGVSRPLRTDLGYHVVKVETREPERVRTLESVPKPSLERKIYSQKFEAAFRRTIDSLETKYTVRVDEKALLGEEGYAEHEARRLFEQAQGTSDAVARIKLYEQIVETYGESKFAAQAQFMIGFVYAEELKDEPKARAALEQVIARYPQSELVDSARWMLENMARGTPALDSGGPPSRHRVRAPREESRPEERAAVIEVRVSGLAIDEKTKSPVVILQEVDGKRILPIWIGQNEANAIALEMAGQKFQRPLTHDLLVSVIRGLRADVVKAIISELKDNTFYATVLLKRDGQDMLAVDARPSDSIALALRARSPIYVSEKLFDGGPGEKVESESLRHLSEEEQAEELRRYLEGLNPEDFGRFQL